MDQTSHEPAPELPRPEHIDPKMGNIEIVSAPGEQYENQPLPHEGLAKANDAVSQALSTNDNAVQDFSAQAVISDDTVSNGNPAIADDVDVIEKEWVEKAKQIVAKTHDDPHAQSKEINMFKHDYMKKRYGKEIKLPNERG